MAESFKFELVSPEKLLISEDVKHVVVPGAEGNFGVMTGHAPFVSTLRAGVLEIIDGTNSSGKKLYVRGGFAEVGPDALTVLAQKALNLSDMTADVIAQEITDVEGDLEANEENSDAYLAAKLALVQLKEIQASA